MSEKVPNLDSEGRLLDKNFAEKLVQKLNNLAAENFGKIIEVEEKNKQENQRLPYSLSTLQIEAGKLYGYSPQIVLDTMQMLYEKEINDLPTFGLRIFAGKSIYKHCR